MSGNRKKSDALTSAQVCAIIDAALYSFCIGKWINRSITIHFAKGGVRPHARRLLKDFLKHAGDWLNKRGFGPAYYIYVFENPPDGGEHVHILMHVPHDLWDDFQAAELRWIRKAVQKLGGKCRRGTLVDKEVFFYSAFTKGSADLSDYLISGLRGSLLYLLKGSDVGLPALLGIDDNEAMRLPEKLRHLPQGSILGKRVGFSESLSRQRHLFPGHEFRPGMWMAGREARARAILRDFGLEFTAPGNRGRPTVLRPVTGPTT